MVKKLPKISIITPVYNNVQYIEHCINSVLGQNYPNLEYIIIDGGSNDGTLEIIEKYADRLFYYVSEKDRGQTHALNKGFHLATGDIYGWLNADEEYLPDTLNFVGNTFKNNPQLEFLYGNRIVVDEKKIKIGEKRYTKMHPKWHLLYRMQIIPSDASFWQSTIHIKTGDLDEENYPQLSMDYDWFLRLSMNIRFWYKADQFLSKFVESANRKTELASKDQIEFNSLRIRNNVMEKHSLLKIKIFFGWIIAGVYERWITNRTFSLPNIRKSLKNHFL